MKKIVFLSLLALCLPWTLSAQSIDDDLYYVPSKNKEEKTEKKEAPANRTVVVKTNKPTTVYTSQGNTTIVVKDRKGNTRSVDEYNRRYDSRNNDFVMDNDTLYVEEKAQPDPDGEWVNGEFNGSEDDYEYATRIIRFRNPRYAVSISSPLYWDVVYGLNSWDWNVYSDGMYAYAFPTFTNRLWSDWRYGSYGWGGYPYYGFGWNSWYGSPSWSFGWGGWYGGGWWGNHHHHYPGGWYPGGGNWGGNWANNTYTNRRSSGSSSYRNSSTVRRYGSTVNRGDGGSSVRSSGTSSYRRGVQGGGGTARRVVGTRSSAERGGVSTRMDASTTRRSVYTRPSSTRVGSSDVTRGTGGGTVNSLGERRSSTRSSSTYSQGSSTAPTRRSSTESTRRSYESSPTNSSSSTRSYSSGSGSSSRSYSTGGGGGGSTRSSGGGSSRRR